MNKKVDKKNELLIRIKKLREKIRSMVPNTGIAEEIVEVLEGTLKLIES